ncbi:MAG TPA: hypothetical protein VGN49_14475, partial [Micrococcaceae bacterium]|nr:hypothetical protein [Micrococcaceae bacterium]
FLVNGEAGKKDARYFRRSTFCQGRGRVPLGNGSGSNRVIPHDYRSHACDIRNRAMGSLVLERVLLEPFIQFLSATVEAATNIGP